MKGVVPLPRTPHDGKWIWVLYSPARQWFTVSQVEKYAVETRSWRDGQDQDNTTTTNSIEPTFKNTIILYE